MRELSLTSLMRIENILEYYTYNIYITNGKELEQACEWLKHKKATWKITYKEVMPYGDRFTPNGFNYVITVSVCPERQYVTYSRDVYSIVDISDDWGDYHTVGYIRAHELNAFYGVNLRRGEKLNESH